MSRISPIFRASTGFVSGIVLSVALTGCELPGMRGGPPGLPGLPGLPGPPHGELTKPSDVLLAAVSIEGRDEFAPRTARQ
jgi:hypothetical protein